MKKLFIISLFLILFTGNASAWYSTDWDHRLPIKINNTEYNPLNYYQFHVSISSGINASSIRVINDTSDTVVSHWCQNVTCGLCYELWFNASVKSEVNNDFYIYYDNTVVASTSSYNDTFDASLVLNMPLDQYNADGTTIYDISLNENVGASANAPVFVADRMGQSDRAMSFNGTSDYVDLGDVNAVDGLSEMTISTWVNPAYTLGLTWIAVKEDVWYFWIDNGNVYYTIHGSPLNNLLTSISADTWFHVVATYSEEGVSYLYINGVQKSTSTTMVTMPISNYELSIGARRSGGGNWVDFFNGSIADVRIYNRALTPAKITALYEAYHPNVTLGNEQSPYVNISLHSKSPETLFTNYTGLLSASYIVESNAELNMSSLAFLIGMNYTLTSDYHSYLKVPGNSIADSGIYRAHNRNTTPYLSWEGNSTITEGNVWKWSGGEYGDFWITNTSINNTHTWVNMTGVASNVFSSMFYLGRSAMYESEKTGIEINRAQGVIFKIWDLEQFRGRNYDYYLSMYFDSQIESTPNANIEIWYCNDSFDPLTDDPCLVCDYKDTWTSDRWMDHEAWQPHSNVSYAKPLQVHAGTATCPSSPTEINYIYLKSGTTTSKSYILNATNSDPGICNLTFGQTNTMWLRNEISGTNTPHAYTPSYFNTFIRDYQEFTHHMYIANDQGVWAHSDYTTHPIGISNLNPTFCKYNYFWWNGTTDYNMNGSYTEDFYINLTYGFDPDNGAALTHVLSLYDEDYNFVTFVNSSLVGNQTDDDVYFNLTEHLTVYYADKYRFKIVSTDNEGSTSVSWSNLFSIPRESKYKNVATVIRAFPATLQHTLTTLLSYIPLLVGGLIAGVLIILVMSIFGKLKRW